MYCPNCGKQCSDNVKFCDGCGAALTHASPQPNTDTYPVNNPPAVYNAPHSGKGEAIAGMVLGIVSFFGGGLITAIVGLALACSAKKKGYNRGMRTAGFVLSLIALIFSIIILIIVIIVACSVAHPVPVRPYMY